MCTIRRSSIQNYFVSRDPNTGGRGGRGTDAHAIDSTAARRGLMALIVLSLVAIPASANHWWGELPLGAHEQPVHPQGGRQRRVGTGMATSQWPFDGALMMDWSKSTVLTTSGGPRCCYCEIPKKCPPTSGRVEVCSASLWRTSVAQLWTQI